jgi:alkaline phosphatase D
MQNPVLFSLGCLLLAGTPVAYGQEKSDFTSPKTLSKIGFGSCFDPKDNESSIFAGILKHQPDACILLGDNIYGDTKDMNVLKEKYAKLEAVEGFRKLRDQTTFVATWDDHDYGANDGGNSYPMRKESQQIFLDFFKEPADSPRRQREGVYASYLYGTKGKICQILLLDTRYFRDELPKKTGKAAKGTVGWYEPSKDTTTTLLGEEQWKWLDQQLKIPADIRIIASSIQVLAVEKGMENWGNVPHEQARLFELLKKHKANHTFAISGDVHFAELSKKDLAGYPFYDFTSSGLSHNSKSWALADNSYRVGKSYWGLNAGLIEIDWAAASIELSVIDPKGEKVSQNVIKLSELEFKK